MKAILLTLIPILLGACDARVEVEEKGKPSKVENKTIEKNTTVIVPEKPREKTVEKTTTTTTEKK